MSDFVEELETFNSLSRDHTLKHFSYIFPSGVRAFNSLSRDHYVILVDEERPAKNNTFNSLSRDHGKVRRIAHPQAGVRFQLPLSGSPAVEARKQAMYESLTFNSLSRDHVRLQQSQEDERVVVFQLPLSGSRDHLQGIPALREGSRSSFNSLSRDHK